MFDFNSSCIYICVFFIKLYFPFQVLNNYTQTVCQTSMGRKPTYLNNLKYKFRRDSMKRYILPRKLNALTGML